MWKNEIFSLFSIGGMELFNEEGITSNGIGALVFIAFCVIVSVAMWIPNSRSKKKGLDSEEKRKVAEIVGQVATGDKVTSAYATV